MPPASTPPPSQLIGADRSKPVDARKVEGLQSLAVTDATLQELVILNHNLRSFLRLFGPLMGLGDLDLL